MVSCYQNLEIIVSDCQTKGISNWIKSNFPEVKLIHFESDIGPAASRNAGLSISNRESKYLVFVDNDTKMDHMWLLTLVDALERNPKIGAAQPILFKMNNPKLIDSVGGFFDNIGYACIPRSQPEFISKNQPICYCEAVTILRRSVLNQFTNPLQPYDPDYFQHWEDIDMCWRIMLLGHKIVSIPESAVFHERGVSAGLGKQSAQLVFLNTKNRLTTLTKHYSLPNLIHYCPLLIFLEFLKAVALLRSNHTHAIATIKGLIWNLINLRKIWIKRTDIQVNRKVADLDIEKVLAKPNIIRLLDDFNRHYA